MRRSCFVILICFALLSGCASATTMIRSTPPNANVFIDGQPVGVTPLELSLAKQSHRVRLEKAGYRTATDYISVVERAPGLLMVLLFPVYWIFADDLKYTFKPVYQFELQASESLPEGGFGKE